MRFYLGAHQPHWLASAGVPLFVSHMRLMHRRTFPRAVAPWALDSGGFTQLSMHGQWTVSPAEYVAAVRRYQQEIGQLDWAAIQDWMCEPFIVARTGLSVVEHQARTVDSYLRLMDMAPELPWAPVLQGWTAPTTCAALTPTSALAWICERSQLWAWAVFAGGRAAPRPRTSCGCWPASS